MVTSETTRRKRTEAARRKRSIIRVVDTLLICGLSISLGAVIGTRATGEKELVSARLTAGAKEYGTYDGKIITEEPEFAWKTDGGDFIPLNVDMSDSMQEYIYYLSQEYDIEFTLVMALIEHESKFNPNTVSSTNDYGLMQINKANHEWLSEALGVTDFLDPEQNVRAGVFVLRKLYEEYTDTNLVLMAYNMGGSNAERLWKEGIYDTDYSRAIKQKQGEYEAYLKEREK